MTGNGKYINGVHILISLKRRIELFLIGSIFCILFVAFAYAFHMDKMFIKAFIISGIVLLVFLLFMITLSYKKIMMAKLIIDNRILHLKQTHITLLKVDDSKLRNSTEAEVFVSCFGIMLDKRIIKFNLDGIVLKSVELSDKYMSFIYGTDSRSKKIRIEHAPMTVQETIRIAENFRYETGVIPVLSDWKRKVV